MIDTAVGALVEVLHHADRKPSPSRAAVSRIVEAASLVPAQWRAFQACVEARESHSNPHALNASGAAGIFQFMPSWRNGLPYVLARGLKAHGMPAAQARTIRLSLPHRIEKWPALMQRAAFAQVLAEGGRSAALRHWAGGHGCNALIPAGAR